MRRYLTLAWIWLLQFTGVFSKFSSGNAVGFSDTIPASNGVGLIKVMVHGRVRWYTVVPTHPTMLLNPKPQTIRDVFAQAWQIGLPAVEFHLRVGALRVERYHAAAFVPRLLMA